MDKKTLTLTVLTCIVVIALVGYAYARGTAKAMVYLIDGLQTQCTEEGMAVVEDDQSPYVITIICEEKNVPALRAE